MNFRLVTEILLVFLLCQFAPQGAFAATASASVECKSLYGDLVERGMGLARGILGSRSTELLSEVEGDFPEAVARRLYQMSINGSYHDFMDYYRQLPSESHRKAAAEVLAVHPSAHLFLLHSLGEEGVPLSSVLSKSPKGSSLLIKELVDEALVDPTGDRMVDLLDHLLVREPTGRGLRYQMELMNALASFEGEAEAKSRSSKAASALIRLAEEKRGDTEVVVRRLELEPHAREFLESVLRSVKYRKVEGTTKSKLVASLERALGVDQAPFVLEEVKSLLSKQFQQGSTDAMVSTLEGLTDAELYQTFLSFKKEGLFQGAMVMSNALVANPVLLQRLVLEAMKQKEGSGELAILVAGSSGARPQILRHLAEYLAAEGKVEMTLEILGKVRDLEGNRRYVGNDAVAEWIRVLGVESQSAFLERVLEVAGQKSEYLGLARWMVEARLDAKEGTTLEQLAERAVSTRSVSLMRIFANASDRPERVRALRAAMETDPFLSHRLLDQLMNSEVGPVERSLVREILLDSSLTGSYAVHLLPTSEGRRKLVNLFGSLMGSPSEKILIEGVVKSGLPDQIFELVSSLPEGAVRTKFVQAYSKSHPEVSDVAKIIELSSSDNRNFRVVVQQIPEGHLHEVYEKLAGKTELRGRLIELRPEVLGHLKGNAFVDAIAIPLNRASTDGDIGAVSSLLAHVHKAQLLERVSPAAAKLLNEMVVLGIANTRSRLSRANVMGRVLSSVDVGTRQMMFEYVAADPRLGMEIIDHWIGGNNMKAASEMIAHLERVQPNAGYYHQVMKHLGEKDPSSLAPLVLALDGGGADHGFLQKAFFLFSERPEDFRLLQEMARHFRSVSNSPKALEKLVESIYSKGSTDLQTSFREKFHDDPVMNPAQTFEVGDAIAALPRTEAGRALAKEYQGQIEVIQSPETPVHERKAAVRALKTALASETGEKDIDMVIDGLKTLVQQQKSSSLKSLRYFFRVPTFNIRLGDLRIKNLAILETVKELAHRHPERALELTEVLLESPYHNLADVSNLSYWMRGIRTTAHGAARIELAKQMLRERELTLEHAGTYAEGIEGFAREKFRDKLGRKSVLASALAAVGLPVAWFFSDAEDYIKESAFGEEEQPQLTEEQKQELERQISNNKSKKSHVVHALSSLVVTAVDQDHRGNSSFIQEIQRLRGRLDALKIVDSSEIDELLAEVTNLEQQMKALSTSNPSTPSAAVN